MRRFMRNYLNTLKREWRFMLEPPLRDNPPNPDPVDAQLGSVRFVWLVIWTWAISGLVLGSLLAPGIIQYWGLTNTRYQDALIIGIAVAVGFIVQWVGWTLLQIMAFFRKMLYDGPDLLLTIWTYITGVIYILPFVGVGYALYRYFTWVGPGHRLVATAFVGGVLVKMLLIPFIKSIVTGTALNLFRKWLGMRNVSNPNRDADRLSTPSP
jgi:hypothetical protein